MIELERVTIGYDGVPLMPPLSLQVDAGDFWGIVGPNGGGKTTLVKSLIGVNPLVRGELRFKGRPPRIGYVPQKLHLLWEQPTVA